MKLKVGMIVVLGNGIIAKVVERANHNIYKLTSPEIQKEKHWLKQNLRHTAALQQAVHHRKTIQSGY